MLEYNDIFMRGEMGLDTDGQWPATINVKKKLCIINR